LKVGAPVTDSLSSREESGVVFDFFFGGGVICASDFRFKVLVRVFFSFVAAEAMTWRNQI
jgi:hypothetical protein